MVNPGPEVDSKLSVYKHNHFIHIQLLRSVVGIIKTISDHKFPKHDARFRYIVSNIAVVNGMEINIIQCEFGSH